MQQIEIERSRYNYSLSNERSTSTSQRHRTRNAIKTKDKISVKSFKFTVPSLPLPAPSTANVSNQAECTQSSNVITKQTTQPTIVSTNSTYPSLTEAILAEHDRLHGTLPLNHATKRNNLIKWTQELALFDHLSPPYPEYEILPESIYHNSTRDKSTNELSSM